MKKFLIRRKMDGAGGIPKHDLNNAGKGSEEVLEAMRSEEKNIMQEQSYLVGNAIFCVYESENEELIREHSERSGAPTNEISEITTVPRPTAAEKTIYASTYSRRLKWERPRMRYPSGRSGAFSITLRALSRARWA